MKSIILLCFLMSNSPCTVQGQCPLYQTYIDKGDSILNKKKNTDFKAAINAYSAAMLHCPAKADFARKKILDVFTAIEKLKKEAEDRAKDARDQKIIAENKTLIAYIEATRAQRLKEISDSLKIEADLSKEQEKLNAKKLEEALEDLKKTTSIILQTSDEKEKLRLKNETLNKTLIGKRYQGGIIFSLTDTTGQHGLIAADKDLGKFSWADANKICDSFSLGGFNDWRLPTKQEILALAANKILVGGFVEDYYWSSTSKGRRRAWVRPFATTEGYRSLYSKYSKHYVRPVRAF